MFSCLQQKILGECMRRRDEIVNRDPMVAYCSEGGLKSNRVKTVTKSLERLIDRGYLVGYGIRTPKKWFIKEVRITRDGTKAYERWLSRKQKKLPI